VRTAVEAKLAELGIPRGAVFTEEWPPYIDKVGTATEDFSAAMLEPDSLTDRIRPILGGTRIGVVLEGRGGGHCTLGFSARLGGVPVFVTNAHCTSLIAENNGNIFGQPDIVLQDTAYAFIGREYRDPSFYVNSYYPLNLGNFGFNDSSCNSGAPGASGWYCRRSDMAIIEAGTSNIAFGYIARTTYDAYGPDGRGSIEIQSSNPRFRIVGEVGSPREGELLDKMGQNTGWTYGAVSNRICIDVPRPHGGANDPNPTRIAFRCQHHVNYGAGEGDSGAPVFRWNFDDTVVLYGIHRGRNQYGASYTSMDMIRLDLGIPVSDRTQLQTTF
jgi:hypothetical protein